MKPAEIKNLLKMFTTVFIVLVVMMTVNQFGVNMMTIVFAYVMLGTTLVSKSLLELDEYYDTLPNNKAQLQFPGWSNQRQVTGHISDILVRVIVTMILIVFFIKSGIFKLENLNPMKMYYA